MPSIDIFCNTQIERLRIRNWVHYFVQVESIWRKNNWIQEQRQKFPKNIKDWKQVCWILQAKIVGKIQINFKLLQISMPLDL